jgi:hypothetical protein
MERVLTFVHAMFLACAVLISLIRSRLARNMSFGVTLSDTS